jgi:hypothetical protein
MKNKGQTPASPHRMGRGGSDWMIPVVCERVVRDTASGGSDIGRMRLLHASEKESANVMVSRYIIV